jgi:hypothetical protein
VESKRTIETILSLSTGELIETEELFKDEKSREAEIFQLRTRIENQLQTNAVDYVCLYCKQAVALRGRVNQQDYTKHFYFTHPYDSQDCLVKKVKHFTEEQIRCIKYNGEKESDRHNTLKNLIGSYLEKTEGVSEVIVDQVYKDKEVSNDWRKPDVLAIYGDKKIAFELQLSTTFLSVVVARTRFYRERGIFLVWVFADFSLINDLQKFTQKDVYYNNNFNVYIFDKEAVEQSRLSGQLVLKCVYKDFFSIGDTIHEQWKSSFIALIDLQFIDSIQEVWYRDASEQKRQVQLQISIEQGERVKKEYERKRAEAINSAVAYLREFYRIDGPPRSLYFPLTSINTGEQIAALNQRLQFDTEKASVITNLFFERNKPNFLELLCENGNIYVDTSKLIKDGRSVFEEILSLYAQEQFKKYISFLFGLGYVTNEKDQILLKQVYDKYRANSTWEEKEQIERWAIIDLFKNVRHTDVFSEVFKVDKLVYAIASMKYKIVIHSGFSHLIQVTHNFLHSHAEYGTLFLKAMKAYGELDKQLQEDKSGKLKVKVARFMISNTDQVNKYNSIIYELFPEIRSIKD